MKRWLATLVLGLSTASVNRTHGQAATSPSPPTSEGAVTQTLPAVSHSRGKDGLGDNSHDGVVARWRHVLSMLSVVSHPALLEPEPGRMNDGSDQALRLWAARAGTTPPRPGRGLFGRIVEATRMHEIPAPRPSVPESTPPPSSKQPLTPINN
jgi:hypothetical protein